jgi:hypothetical protein
MTFHRSLRRLARAVLAATMLLALGATSDAFAQAHCNSSAPEVVATASNGVVMFSPAAALPCPAIPNPGGQVHPGAGS